MTEKHILVGKQDSITQHTTYQNGDTLILNDSTTVSILGRGSRPIATAEHHKKFWVSMGSLGEDILYICLLDATGHYVWEVVSGGTAEGDSSCYDRLQHYYELCRFSNATWR